MNCSDARRLLHPYLDGELDLTETRSVERHLRECASCARAYASQRALSGAVQDTAPYFPASKQLRERVRSSLRQDRQIMEPRRAPGWSWRWFALATALACALGLGLGLGRFWVTPVTSGDDAVAQEVVVGHVRSLMVDHLTDVPSSDKHTVKPWFAGRLDFSPSVEDYAAQGFPLLGGRLDYLDNRPVSALVYRYQRHLINMFVWPSSQPAEELSPTIVREGYQLIHWTSGGMTYWVVSDLNADELRSFAELIRQHATTAS